MEEKVIDNRQSVDRPMIIERNRDFKNQYQAQRYSDETNSFLALFDFSLYSSAIMEVRTRYTDFNYVLRFSTEDGSIILGDNGIFTLYKPASELKVRSGEYVYDMYLIGNGYEKRPLLRGSFTITDTVTK